MEYPERLVDKRIVERNIQKGFVDRKEYDKLLKQLPDTADNVEVVSVESEIETDEI